MKNKIFAIVNVMEVLKGIVSNIHSFPIFNEKDEKTVVKEAEEFFLKLAHENGSKESEYSDDDLLDNGSWDDENGYEVIIHWSEQIHQQTEQEYSQLVLVEFNNSAPGIIKYQSDKKITLEKVVHHVDNTLGFDEERDSVTFVDDPKVEVI